MSKRVLRSTCSAYTGRKHRQHKILKRRMFNVSQIRKLLPQFDGSLLICSFDDEYFLGNLFLIPFLTAFFLSILMVLVQFIDQLTAFDIFLNMMVFSTPFDYLDFQQCQIGLTTAMVNEELVPIQLDVTKRFQVTR